MGPQIIQILELADKNLEMILFICQRKQSKMNKMKRWDLKKSNEHSGVENV